MPFTGSTWKIATGVARCFEEWQETENPFIDPTRRNISKKKNTRS